MQMIIISLNELKSYVMRYHEYFNSWRLKINETLSNKTEPKSIMYKFQVAVIKDESVAGYLM